MLLRTQHRDPGLYPNKTRLKLTDRPLRIHQHNISRTYDTKQKRQTEIRKGKNFGRL
jgi:hypothetical protein